jgi:MFS family permease
MLVPAEELTTVPTQLDRELSWLSTPRVQTNRDVTSKDVSNPQHLDWHGSDDADNPYNWPLKKKWTITAIAVLATFTTLLNGTIITVAHDAINEEFGVSDANFPNSYWPVTSWALGGAIFSLAVLPLMEDFGIRSGFLTTYGVFICFVVPQAVARNFATLIISRFFAGGCVSVLANTSASVIGNIWEGERGRTIPMALYVTAYLTGSSMGPVIGGVIFQSLNWRWISYLQLIWYGCLAPIYCFFFDESRGSVVLQRRAKKKLKLEKDSRFLTPSHETPLYQKLINSIRRPIYMLTTEPVVFVFTVWSAFMVGTVYLFTQSVEQVFAGLYGWTASQAGYVQVAVVIGECIGWVGALISAKFYFASASRNQEVPGSPIPEARLYMSLIGSFVGVTGGMFVYGWTSYPFLPWIAPAIGLVMVGFGTNVVVIAIADYVVDAYSKYAASAVAAIVLGENIFAAFLPLAAQSMYKNLGFQWGSTVLGFLSLVLSFAPVVIVIYGRRIRGRSPFMKEAIIERTTSLNA